MRNPSGAKLWTAMAAMPLAALLAACGGSEHYAPVDDQSASLGVDSTRRAHVTSGTVNTAVDSGTLVVATRGAAPSFLGSVHAVARDADGNIVAGADEDQNPTASGDARGELSLLIPEGDSYSIGLDALSTEAEPTECHAVVAPIAVVAGQSARLQLLSWQCGERTGYVPPSVESACYWLVNWMTVGSAAVSIGQATSLKIQRSAELAVVPDVAWRAEPAAAGHFSAPRAAETSFVCDAEQSSVTLRATVSLGDCVEQLSQTIACAR